MRIAIQGELGSFSHQAAAKMAPKATIVPCRTSAEVFAKLADKRVGAAVIPIENSIAGSVNEHYDLLLDTECHIEREYSLRIVHNLIASKGTKLTSIRRVLSHPVALAQCRRFLARNPALVPEAFYDTAGSVKYIVGADLEDTAAIAGNFAVEHHGGRILRRAIQDNKDNFTRFFLLRRGILPASIAREANKSAVAFSLPNRAGTLLAALNGFAEERISVSRIESRPLRGRPWEYVFYLEFLSGRTAAAQRALRSLREHARRVRLLGVYQASR